MQALVALALLLAALGLPIAASGAGSVNQTVQVRESQGLAQENGSSESDGDCGDLWFMKRNGACECGASVHGAVFCDNTTKSVAVEDCYCMTMQLSSHQMVVGGCVFNCVNMSRTEEYLDQFYHPAPSQCSELHRSGTLCGQCDHKQHYYSPSYSYDLKCSKCKKPDSWWLYIAVAFLPLTVFIVLILVFRISAVSPPLHAFIGFAQISCAPIQVRILLLSTKYTNFVPSLMTKIVASLYGFWNFDFFRTLAPGVCLHLTTMQVLALDYLIAVYPMLLMVGAYILTELHATGFKPVLLMWRPFHYISARFRREVNIQTTLIDAFVTFFILSSTKLFSVSFDLLIPTTLYDVMGDQVGTYLYYDPNIRYMRNSSGHLYYGLLAMIVLTFFFILPLSLLICSGCNCCRTLRRLRVIKEFLHTFQEFYRDGADGGRDYRWYAAFHHISLFGIYLIYTFVKNGFVYVLAPVYYTLAAIIVVLLQPYKPEYDSYNTLDVVFYLWQALFAVGITVLNNASELQRGYIAVGYAVTMMVGMVPLVFISGLVVRWGLRRIGCTRWEKHNSFDDSSLAHRITNSQEYKDSCGYVALLHSQDSIDQQH